MLQNHFLTSTMHTHSIKLMYIFKIHEHIPERFISRYIKRGSRVLAECLAHWLLVLVVPGSIPAGGEEKLLVRTRFPLCHLQELHDTVRRPSDRDVNWRTPVQGQSSPVRVKDPYTGSILMHADSPCSTMYTSQE